MSPVCFDTEPGTLLSRITLPIFVQTPTLPLPTWMMDDDDGEGDAGGDEWGADDHCDNGDDDDFLFLILGYAVVSYRECDCRPVSHSSFLLFSPLQPLQVYHHPDCPNDLHLSSLCPHRCAHIHSRVTPTLHLCK